MALIRTSRAILPSIFQQLCYEAPLGLRASSTQADKAKTGNQLKQAAAETPAAAIEQTAKPQTALPVAQTAASPAESSSASHAAVSDAQSGFTAEEQEWTEVIDEKSGQPYYWNQRTGETTELGEPRPRTRFRNRDWEQASGTGPFQEGFEEPVLPDKTYRYSLIGVGIGVVAGWLTQYMH